MKKPIIYNPVIKKPGRIPLILVGFLIIMGIGLLTFRPVPILPENALVVFKGKVVEIYEGGVNDVNFKIEGRDELFYINRGLEKGLNLQELKAQLINQKITVKYPDHWTLLNFNKRNIHISKIEYLGETLFTEVN
ncbi:hypothetical protein [Daejeonella lutea]|uniref:Uncharacterized protein n=1 Tax=Daejeonella lutea TaxID=572036 RepID=A0A1T5A8T3_9SPHI|nr:hypothetical protein [Daejeonella lutea]SKB31404.1 hypothetical protein SAMN05661099_0462 [Daejeonella lutea]